MPIQEPSAPPPYETANTYGSDFDPPKVVFQPTNYSGPGECSGEPSNITPGGLRLDKAKRIGNRLIIDFEKVSCCPGQVTGLDPDCRNCVPEELRVKGIKQDVWSEWCDDLMKVQKKSPSIGGCLCIFCFPAGLVQAIFCAMCCPTSGDHCLKSLPCFYGDWYVGLREWQASVNSVLNKKDMHAKLKTYKPYNRAPRSIGYETRKIGKDEKYEMSMLEIALTAEESQKLREEGWDNGVNDGCTSGSGRIL